MNSRHGPLIILILAVGLAAGWWAYRMPAVPEPTTGPDTAQPAPAEPQGPPAPQNRPSAKAQTPAEPAQRDSGRFTVRVTDAASGEPIEEYDVAFLNHLPESSQAWRVAQANPAQLWTAVNEPSGQAAWPRAMLDGVRAVGIRAPQFAPQWKPVPENGRLEFALDPGAVVRGRVVSRHGAPLSEADVTVGRSEVQTDADGRFEVGGLSTGTIAIRAQHSDYQSEQVQLTLSPGNVHDVQLTLNEGGAIEGYVYNDTAPVAGATVSVMRAAAFDEHRTVRTDGEGYFRVAGLAAGEWHAMARRSQEPDAPELHQRAVVERGHETAVEFIFGRPAVIEGLVIVGGRPAANATVKARSVSGYDEQFADARTNNGGWYRLEIAPGTVQLSAELSATGASPRKKSVVLDVPAETTEYDFTFDKPVPLSGRIAGLLPEETVNVYVLPEGYAVNFDAPAWGVALSRDALAHTAADASGLFAVETLEPGRYALAIVAFDPEPPAGIDALTTARVLEQDVHLDTGGTHIELSF